MISLTISDLRTQDASVEEELTRWFKMADKWRAILLIDECDVFLERREKKDIERNAIVSGTFMYYGRNACVRLLLTALMQQPSYER